MSVSSKLYASYNVVIKSMYMVTTNVADDPDVVCNIITIAIVHTKVVNSNSA